MLCRHNHSKPTVTRKIKFVPFVGEVKKKKKKRFCENLILSRTLNFPPTFSLLKAEDDQYIYSLKLSECCLLSAAHASTLSLVPTGISYSWKK